jgi:molybdopterin molybdotransferase
VTTGAELPPGADAVLAVEFTQREGSDLLCLRDAGPGRNVMERGSDVAAGEIIAGRGQLLSPALTGLLAAGGLSSLTVHRPPRVGIVAIGDEVVLPGKELRRGQLYASNVVTLVGWLEHFRLGAEVAAVGDREGDIRATVAKMLEGCDAVLTSGGAWKSDRDLTVKVVKNLGGDLLFHRVRIGPGKAAALALVDRKPVFCLPGGPASNEMAFLQIALPGLLRLAGRNPRPFPIRRARLSEDLAGVTDWTQFFQADIRCDSGEWSVAPIRMKSRLRSQARANALLKLPEGESRIEKGGEVAVEVLFWPGELS